jgi:CelD/BcsL family acetyltransferase involved in cellulose biosynthesis
MRLNSQRWQARGEPGSFGVPEKRRLAEELARRFFASGWLDFWVLDLDGKPAAMEFAFRIDGVFYPLWVALDTGYKDYSPGSVLKALIIEQLIRNGVRAYDFMQGADPYKARWGIEERKYDWASCVRPYSRAALHFRLAELQMRGRRFARRHGERAKAKLGAVLPAAVAKMLGAPIAAQPVVDQFVVDTAAADRPAA